ncbi:Secretion system C-terminal sorting domain [Flavobacteriaceae bacterium]
MPMIFNFAEGFSNTINAFGGNTNVDVPITPLRAFSLADVPAARQMQYTWVSNTGSIDNTIHSSWQQELSNLGYPQGYVGKPIRNIAIANGSECGITQIDNGNIMSYIKDAGRDAFLSNYIGIMDAVYGTLITRPDIVVAALFPGKSYWEIDFQSKYMTTLNQSKNIYHGSIKYKKKVFWFIPISISVTNMDVNQPLGILPYDIYGGGIQKTNNKQLPLDNIVSNGFGFIPTASALDIGKGTTVIYDTEYRKSFVGAIPPIAPKNSPFQNFVSNFDINNTTNNSTHISFNRRNGDWLTAELIANSNSAASPEYANCSYLCSGTTAQMTGPNTLCTSAVFTVPTGAATYKWTITEGASLVSFSGDITSSLSLTHVGTSSGYVTIAISYGNVVCGEVTLTKRIWVGEPIFILVRDNNESEFCDTKYHYVTFIANLLDSNSSLQFVSISPSSGVTYNSQNSITFKFSKTYSGVFNPTIRAVNNCGSFLVEPEDEIYIQNCNSLSVQSKVNLLNANSDFYLIYPNPATDIINITIFDKNNTPISENIIIATLYDLMGVEKRKVKILNNTAAIEVNGLKKGIYVLKIDIDGQIESHQVAIQ